MALKQNIIDMAFALNNTRVVRPDRMEDCDAILDMIRPIEQYINKHGDPTITDYDGRDFDVIDC